MSSVKGKNAVVSISGFTSPAASGSHDLSIYIDTSSLNLGADIVDLTTYGKTGHVPGGALKTCGFSCGGVYDTSQTNGPSWVLALNCGESCTVTFKPEGTATGKPTYTFTAVLKTYNTTAAVGDYIRWNAEWDGDADSVALSIQ